MRALVVRWLGIGWMALWSVSASAQSAQGGDRAAVVMKEEIEALLVRVEQLEEQVEGLREVGDDLDDFSGRLGHLETHAMRVIDESIGIDVPEDYPTLADALDSLERYRLVGDAQVFISIAPGTWSFDQTVVFDHPDGHRFWITGRSGDPSEVVLHYTGEGSALSVGANRVVGHLDGVTIRGDGASKGIEAVHGGVFRCGSNVVVTGFEHAGFSAHMGGVIHADGAIARANPGRGFAAETQGLIRAWSATAEDNGADGFFTMDSSVIYAVWATARGNGGDGFAAHRSSAVDASDGAAHGNAGAGFSATYGSMLLAESAVASGNGWAGFGAWSSSSILARHPLAVDNQGAGFAAGPTSSIDMWTGTAERNGDGFDAYGNGFLTSEGATALDNRDFGFNVFWGGWMRVNGAEASGNTWDYNLGPWSWDTLPDETGWGVIWHD